MNNASMPVSHVKCSTCAEHIVSIHNPAMWGLFRLHSEFSGLILILLQHLQAFNFTGLTQIFHFLACM